jgi:hypothetical protein
MHCWPLDQRSTVHRARQPNYPWTAWSCTDVLDLKQRRGIPWYDLSHRLRIQQPRDPDSTTPAPAGGDTPAQRRPWSAEPIPVFTCSISNSAQLLIVEGLMSTGVDLLPGIDDSTTLATVHDGSATKLNHDEKSTTPWCSHAPSATTRIFVEGHGCTRATHRDAMVDAGEISPLTVLYLPLQRTARRRLCGGALSLREEVARVRKKGHRSAHISSGDLAQRERDGRPWPDYGGDSCGHRCEEGERALTSGTRGAVGQSARVQMVRRARLWPTRRACLSARVCIKKMGRAAWFLVWAKVKDQSPGKSLFLLCFIFCFLFSLTILNLILNSEFEFHHCVKYTNSISNMYKNNTYIYFILIFIHLVIFLLLSFSNSWIFLEFKFHFGFF